MMESVVNPKPYEETGRRAASFFERRRFQDWTAADQAELDAWLAESPLHRVAYLRVEWSFSRAEQLAGLAPSEPKPAAPSARSKFPIRRFVLPLLAAASIALIATVALPFVLSLMQPADRTFSTDVGGRTLVKFADGTEIELNTDTAMRFRMTSAERMVWLEKGEAWFHVMHNTAHPFTVVVGKHRVTDIGTEFAIRRDAADMEVALVSGRAMLNTEGTPTTMLAPGDDAVATPASVSVTWKTPQQLADALAWRRGMLVFRNTKLADVVREFNRYNATKLVIADPSIADEPFTADLKAHDYEAFLNLAQTVLNLRAEHAGNDILISRGSRGDMKRAVRLKHND